MDRANAVHVVPFVHARVLTSSRVWVSKRLPVMSYEFSYTNLMLLKPGTLVMVPGTTR